MLTLQLKEHWARSQKAGVCFLPLLPKGYVTAGRSLDLSEGLASVCVE